MQRCGAAAIVAGVLGFAGTAHADCEPARGDSAVMAVAKGMAVRVMYLRPGPYNNYLEVCVRTAAGKPWEMVTGEFANASDWYELWSDDAEAFDYELNFWGGYVTDADPAPWPGARRTMTPTGATLAYYGMNLTAAMPNTIVEVCILADLKACPAH
jgi:hypothetical protein